MAPGNERITPHGRMAQRRGPERRFASLVRTRSREVHPVPGNYLFIDVSPLLHPVICLSLNYLFFQATMVMMSDDCFITLSSLGCFGYKLLEHFELTSEECCIVSLPGVIKINRRVMTTYAGHDLFGCQTIFISRYRRAHALMSLSAAR